MTRHSVVFIQMGDYGGAWHRFADGGPETYRDQRRSVGFVEALTRDYDVTVVSLANEAKDEALTNTLRAIAIPRHEMGPIVAEKLFDELSPHRLICRTPLLPALTEAADRQILTLPSFADLFQKGWLRGRRHMGRLRRVLNRLNAPCIANHSLNASRSIADTLGLPASRIVPWDWSRLDVSPTLKDRPGDPNGPSIFFAGALREDKGVNDCLEAIVRLNAEQLFVQGHFAGGGDLAFWQDKAARLGLTDQVTFHGMLPHTEVRAHMQLHDIVVVPSHHSYPEGLPNTIYEALASRTPLIVSDHPAFKGRLTDGQGCLSFQAGDPAKLADAMRRLLRDFTQYASLSRNAKDTHDALYIGMEWTELLQAFLEDPSNRTGWVQANALPALGY